MGQIVIDIPNQKSRRYVLADRLRANELLKALEESAIRVKGDLAKLTTRQIEEIGDYLDAKAALDEMRTSGKSYSITQLRKEIGV